MLVLAGLALTGCADEPARPTPSTAPAREAGVVVRSLARAAAAEDYVTICDDLVASAVRRRAGGRDCPRLLRRSAASVRRPRLRLESTAVVTPDLVRVKVRTRARGQRESRDTIELRRERGRLRITSLGG